MMTVANGKRLVAVLVGVVFGASQAVAQSTVTVELQGGNVFSPADVTIDVGDTVHWVWVAGNHNVQSGTVVSGSGVPDSIFRSGDPTPTAGTTYDVVFDQTFLDANPMTNNVYPYYCDPHTGVGMIGSVTVQATSACTANTDCDDSDACNGAETCSSGSCVSGTAMDCDDSDDCTTDACASGGCTHTPIAGCVTTDPPPSDGCTADADCDDANDCTDDACASGTCSNTEIAGCVTTDPPSDGCTADADCDDADDCTDDACTDGACANTEIAGCGGAGTDAGTDTGTGTGGDGATSDETTNDGGSSGSAGLCGAMGMVPLMFCFLGLSTARVVRRRGSYASRANARRPGLR